MVKINDLRKIASRRFTLCLYSFVALSVVLIPAKARATQYYIDNSNVGSTCNDSGAGTSETAPWCDFSTFNTTTFSPGDVIYLHAGDIWNQSVTLNGSGSSSGGVITLTSYGSGNKPEITYGTSAYGSRVIYGHDVSYWTISGLDIQDTSTAAFDTGAHLYDYSCAIYLYFDGAGPYSHITISNNVLHGSGMTHNNVLLEVYSGDSSITSPAVQYMEITDNTIHDAGQYLVYIAAPESLYDGSTYVAAFSYLTFKGNTLYNSYIQGAQISDTTNGTIEDNVVYSTGQYTGTWNNGIGALWVLGCSQTMLDDNEVYNNSDAGSGNDAAGIDVDWYNSYVTVTSNYLHDNKGPGLEILDNNNTSASYNRIYNNQAATSCGSGQICLWGQGSSNPGITNASIAHNVVVLNTYASKGLTTKDTNGHTWSGDSFTNNYDLFIGSDWAYDLETNGYGAMSTVNNNQFYGDGSSIAATLNGTTEYTLSDWRSFSGFDTGSSEAAGSTVSQEQADFTPSGHSSNQWTYYYSTNGESSFNAMTWDEADQWWVGSQSYCLIAAGLAQAGYSTCDAVLTWTAPASGTAVISSDNIISVESGCGGSGASIRILQNGSQIWPASGWQSIGNGGNYTFPGVSTTVSTNDELEFVVTHNGSNNYCDAVYWNPVVVL